MRWSAPVFQILSILLTISSFSLLFPFTTECLVIRIPHGKVKCVTEDLHTKSVSVANYKILNDDQSISARVTDPDGEIVHRADDVESGQLAIEAKVAGKYNACFFSSRFALGSDVSVDLEWRVGIPSAKGFGFGLHKVAKKESVQAVEDELKKLEDSVNSIFEEMRFLREREEEGQKLYEEMNSRMGMLSLLSLVICLGVSGFQLWHLKTFFEREKIL